MNWSCTMVKTLVLPMPVLAMSLLAAQAYGVSSTGYVNAVTWYTGANGSFADSSKWYTPEPSPTFRTPTENDTATFGNRNYPTQKYTVTVPNDTTVGGIDAYDDVTLDLSGNKLTVKDWLTVNEKRDVTITNGKLNAPYLVVGDGASLTLDVQELAPFSYIDLNNGKLTSNTPIVVNGTLHGVGEIAGSGGIILNGSLDTYWNSNYRLVISNTGNNVNNGSMYISNTLQIDTNLTNKKYIGGSNGVIEGEGTLINQSGGSIEYLWRISCSFSNPSGTIRVGSGLTVTKPFTSGGVITVETQYYSNSSLSGGALTNTGTIQDANSYYYYYGNPYAFSFNNDLVNSGLVRFDYQNVNFNGSVANQAGGMMLFGNNNNVRKVFLMNGLSGPNAGTISLAGNEFNTNAKPLTNDGVIYGWGTFLTGPITNNNIMTLNGGYSMFYSDLTNNPSGTVTFFSSATFIGQVVNNGSMTILPGASVMFFGGIRGNTVAYQGSNLMPSGAMAVEDAGILTISAGATVTSGTIHQGALSLMGSLTIMQTAGDMLSVLDSLSISDGGLLDLMSSSLLLHHNAPSDVREMLRSAYNDGRWTGRGLKSSMTNPADHRVLAYMTGDAYREFYGEFFNDEFIGESDVLITMTMAGDANLDGYVDGDDYRLMDLGRLLGIGNTWLLGDFNYDGMVDGEDYAIMDTSYSYFNQTHLTPELIQQRVNEFGESYLRGLAGNATATPEPASLALLGLGAVALLRRRK